MRWSATQGTLLGQETQRAWTGGGTFNVTMSWTLAPSSEFALVGIPIHAAAPTGQRTSWPRTQLGEWPGRLRAFRAGVGSGRLPRLA